MTNSQTIILKEDEPQPFTITEGGGPCDLNGVNIFLFDELNWYEVPDNCIDRTSGRISLPWKLRAGNWDINLVAPNGTVYWSGAIIVLASIAN